MDRDLPKYIEEENQILDELVDMLKKSITESLKTEDSTGDIGVKKCKVNAKKPEDLDYAVILSVFLELKEPVMILRVKYEYSVEDEFEIVDDDTPKPKSRPLEDYASAGFTKRGIEMGLDVLDMYFLNTMPWSEYERDFTAFKKTKKATFFALEYKILKHDRFMMKYYHTEMFEDTFMRQSQLFANRSIVQVADLKLKTPGLEMEELHNSLSTSQIINKNFKIVEKMCSKIMEKDKQFVKDKFNKKGKAQEVDAKKENYKKPSTVTIEEKTFQRLYEKIDNVSMIVYNPMASLHGTSVMPNRVTTTNTKSEIYQNLPTDADELEGPEVKYDESQVIENVIVDHKTNNVIKNAYEDFNDDNEEGCFFDNNFMNDSQAQEAENPQLQESEVIFNGVLLFENSIKADLLLTKDHELVK